jgi:hypothetical protein
VSPQAFCGVKKIIPVQLDLVVRFAQECAITRYDAIVCQERGNHVDEVTPKKKDMVRKTERWLVLLVLTIIVPVKLDVK